MIRCEWAHAGRRSCGSRSGHRNNIHVQCNEALLATRSFLGRKRVRRRLDAQVLSRHPALATGCVWSTAITQSEGLGAPPRPSIFRRIPEKNLLQSLILAPQQVEDSVKSFGRNLSVPGAAKKRLANSLVLRTGLAQSEPQVRGAAEFGEIALGHVLEHRCYGCPSIPWQRLTPAFHLAEESVRDHKPGRRLSQT